MAKVIFEFNSGKYTIQCLPTDSMSKLCQQFANKLQIKIESLTFLYNGEKLDNTLTFEEQANLTDAEKKEMIVLVYDLNQDKEEQKENKTKEDPELEKDVEAIKEKLNSILSTYLDDRKYVKEKVDNWRDAIMEGCESFLKIYKDKYKIYANLIISNPTIKNRDFIGSFNYKFYLKRIFVEFKSPHIKAGLALYLFSKNKKYKKEEIENIFDSISKLFMNLADCREYHIFKSKYYKTFKDELEKITAKKHIIYFYRISNNYYEFGIAFRVFNPNKDNYILSKIIKTENTTLSLCIAQN